MKNARKQVNILFGFRNLRLLTRAVLQLIYFRGVPTTKYTDSLIPLAVSLLLLVI